MRRLTPKQEAFCREFIKCGDKTEAYKRVYNTAKMKQKTISRKAYELFEKDKNGALTAYIKELDQKKENNNIADAKEIQEFLTKMIRGEIEEECVTVEGTGDGCSEAKIINKQITPKDRIKAGETLAKMRGYFDLKIKIDNTPIIKDDI